MQATFFLGSCTPRGFSTFASELAEECGAVDYIKGGSGCGKSTFLRRIADEAAARGLEVWRFLCSSDPQSLDAVVLPSLGRGWVDATAPHVLEPTLCAGWEGYVDFGAFYDRAGIARVEPELRRRKRENAAQYPLVTACLAAADRLLDPARAMWEEPRCRRDLEELAGCLALTALRPSGRQGRVRRRFLSAVTPEGLSFCTETAAAVCGRVYVLEDSYGLAPALLQRVLEQALQLGQTCLVCYTPLQPDGAPAHLLVPGAGAAFVASSPDFPYAGERCCTLELDGTLPPAARDTLRFARDTAGTLLRKAAEHVREAKRIHDELEALCRPYVDFAAADALVERTLHELFPA